MESQFPQDNPPPLPPPPPGPLPYARPVPMPMALAAGTMYHQAAKAAWAAPVIALLLGCLINGAMGPATKDRTAGLLQGVVSLGLILVGFVCGIFALFGMRRYGKSGILVPAIVGLLINGAFVVLTVGAFTALSRARVSAARIAGGGGSAAPPPAPITSPQSALRQTGWMAVARTDAGCTVGAVAMAEPHRDTTALKANFSVPCSVLVMWFDNRAGKGGVTVDTDAAALRMDDGSTVNALRTRDVLGTAKVDRAQFLSRYSPPFVAPAGVNVDGKFLFVPPGVDLSRATQLYVTVDGTRIGIRGRVFTAQEKTDALNAGAGQGAP